MNKKRLLSILLTLCLLVASVSSGINVFASEPINVATSATVQASHLGEDWFVDAGYNTDALKDESAGLYSFFYGSTFVYDDPTSETMSITMTFERTYKINQIQLYPAMDSDQLGGGFPVDFRYEVLTASGWQMIENYEDYVAPTTPDGVPFDIEAVDCRAMRLVVTENGACNDFEGNPAYSLRLAEIEVYGVESSVDIPLEQQPFNVALLAEAQVSHPGEDWFVDAGYNTDALKDESAGLYSFFYGSTFVYDDPTSETMSITMTFDRTYKINQIQLYPAMDSDQLGGGFPVDFRYEVLTSSGWQTIKNYEDYVAPTTPDGVPFDIEEVICRAIRLVVTENGACNDFEGNPAYSLRLAEMEVYGVEAQEQAVYGEIQTLGKAFASTSYEYSEGVVNIGLAQLNDGVADNPWELIYCSSEFANAIGNEYVGVTFEDAYWIDKVAVSGLGSEFPKAFHISVYDGDKWVTVLSKKEYEPQGSDGVTENFTFDKICGTAVKFTADEMNIANPGSQTYGIKMSELAISGVKATEVKLNTPGTARFNVLEGMEVTASSVVDWGEPTFGSNLDNLIDNDNSDSPIETLYASTFLRTPDNCEWVQVTFDAPVSAGYLEFDRWFDTDTYRFPKDFRIELFDGTKWETVVEVTDYENECNKFALPGKICTAIRMTATKLDVAGDSYAFVLRNMRMFGENAMGAAKIADEIPKRQNQSPASRIVGSGQGVAYLGDGVFGGENYYTSKQYQNSDNEVELEFLFERVTYVDRVRFEAHEAGVFPENVKVYALVDDTWKLAYNIDNYDPGEANRHEFAFEAVVCSRIKLVAEDVPMLADGTYAWQLDEVWLNGVAVGEKVNDNTIVENVGYQKPVYASTVLKADIANKSYLNDGITTNFYSSLDIGDNKRTEWVAIDLQGSYEISKINLMPRYYNGEILGFPKSLTVEVWNGNKWVVVAEKKDITVTDELQLTVAPIVGSAVRVMATEQTMAYPNRAAINGLQLAEMEVYGKLSESEVGRCTDFGPIPDAQTGGFWSSLLSPITGDQAVVYLYGVLLLISAAMLFSVLKRKVRK